MFGRSHKTEIAGIVYESVRMPTRDEASAADKWYHYTIACLGVLAIGIVVLLWPVVLVGLLTTGLNVSFPDLFRDCSLFSNGYLPCAPPRSVWDHEGWLFGCFLNTFWFLVAIFASFGRRR